MSSLASIVNCTRRRESGKHRGLPKLQRVHLTEALETGKVGLARTPSAASPVEDAWRSASSSA